jgi:hypothetical protein
MGWTPIGCLPATLNQHRSTPPIPVVDAGVADARDGASQ